MGRQSKPPEGRGTPTKRQSANASRKTQPPTRATTAKRERRRSPRRTIATTLLVIGGVMILAFGASVGYITSMLKGLPTITPATFYNQSAASVVYDRKGQVLGRFAKDGDRQPISSISQVSPNLVNAFVAAEDKTFFHNLGINPVSIVRAFVQDLMSHHIQSGASTITQQTVKLAVFPAQQRTLRRKVQEIALALEVNHMLSKDEILTDYMNWVYMGQMGGMNVYGVKTASELLFHKDPRDLNLPEAAFLASIVNNASYFSPYQFFDHTVARQHYVLKQMLLNQMIDNQQYQQALAFDIHKVLQKQPSGTTRFPYLMFDNIEPLVVHNLVQSGVYDSVQQAELALPTAGFRIYTSLDLKMQNDVDKILSNEQLFAGTSKAVPGLPNQPADLYEAGVTLIDNQTGGILAIGGGRDYWKDTIDHSDIPRRPGSSIKPLIDYGPAIDLRDLTAGTILDDAPVNIAGYKPHDDEPVWQGIVTARQALVQSLNVPAVRVLNMITPEVGTSYLPKMGITTSSTPVNNPAQPTLTTDDTHQLSTAIGGMAYGLTVQQMTSAYTVFPNQGVWRQSYLVQRITDHSGNLLYDFKPQVTQVFSPQTAYIMTSVLHDVVLHGTGASIGAHFPNDYIAGKTGTSDHQVDGWFIGYTQKYTMGIWMGYNHQQPIDLNNYGLKFALWNDIMDPVLAQNEPHAAPFVRPTGIVQMSICDKSGQLPNQLCNTAGTVYPELFLQGTEPTATDSVHVQVKYVTYAGKRYLATTNTPPGDVRTGVFLNPPWPVPNVKTADSALYVPTQPDPRGGAVLEGPTTAPPEISVLAAPQGVQAIPLAGGIEVSWNAVPGATGYMLWRSTSITGPYTAIYGPTKSLQFLDNNVTLTATGIFYQVYALSSSGMSGGSTPVGVNPDTGNTTGNSVTGTTGPGAGGSPGDNWTGTNTGPATGNGVSGNGFSGNGTGNGTLAGNGLDLNSVNNQLGNATTSPMRNAQRGTTTPPSWRLPGTSESGAWTSP